MERDKHVQKVPALAFWWVELPSGGASLPTDWRTVVSGQGWRLNGMLDVSTTCCSVMGKGTGNHQRQDAKVTNTTLTTALLSRALSRVLWSTCSQRWLLILPVSQQWLYCPPLLRGCWPFSFSMIYFAEEALAVLVLGQGKAVTDVRDLFHAVTSQLAGQLAVVS